MPNKEGWSNPSQKGRRRQKLHEGQNDVGNEKNKPKYENFDGKPIE